MKDQLPKNRKLKSPRPRDDKAARPSGSGLGARIRGGFRRVGSVVWPERFPIERRERLRHKPRGFIWIWALSVALASAAFIAHLHVRFDIIQTGYSLSQAQAEQRRLRLAQRELRLELATIKEPGRIEHQAREMLGMARPDHDRIIRLGSRARLARRR